MSNSLIQELFKINKERIEQVDRTLRENSDKTVSSITYNFVNCTLSEAQAFAPVNTEYRHITDARKSGETAGNGTGLPAFFDVSSGSWLDFAGNPIQV